jgi:hypothetical protein
MDRVRGAICLARSISGSMGFANSTGTLGAMPTDDGRLNTRSRKRRLGLLPRVRGGGQGAGAEIIQHEEADRG